MTSSFAHVTHMTQDDISKGLADHTDIAAAAAARWVACFDIESDCAWKEKPTYGLA
jgi:hypothetical protein